MKLKTGVGMKLKVARKLGLDCGHFTAQEEREWTERNSFYQYHIFASPMVGYDKEYCEQCNDSKIIKRVQVYLVERDIPELT